MSNKKDQTSSANNAERESDLIPVQQVVESFDPAGVAELDLYQKREKIYTRKIEGFFQRLRVYTGWPLLLGYFLLPWVNWDGRQAVLFDLPERQFHIFSITFWPQDFPLLALLLIIAAFSLFAITAWLGRVWCGYTCPQTVWTAIYMWAEQFCEGSRNQRIKRDKGPMSRDKFSRKFVKHAMWVGFALFTGVTFVGYFSPIRELSHSFFGGYGVGPWEFAWISFFTCATYINAAYMREQVCIYMCPYARFQSVMFDKDTLIVSYNPERGEKRGARKKSSNPAELGLGDCVDCQVCVQVCPTGIDIRDGLQYECINCALCIDGCNSVMDQMGYERGLISYTTEHELEGNKTHFLRPRLVGYATAVLIMVALFVSVVISRVPLQLEVLRDRDRLYLEAGEGMIENSYTLKILNMDQAQHDYKIVVAGLEGVTIVGSDTATLVAGEVVEIPIRLSIDPANLKQANSTILFSVDATDDSDLHAEAESRFIGPGL